MPVSERVHAVLTSRANIDADYFGGWIAEDIELLDRWAADLAGVEIEPGYVIDWLGCRTDLRNYARFPVPPAGGLVIDDLPIPTDSLHADAIEYIGLLTGVERALESKRRAFNMLELGASYAPWAVHAGLAARRAGFDSINLVAVEASASAIERIQAHAKVNGLSDDSKVRLTALHAAVGATTGTMHFPIVDTSVDNGAQASAKRRKVDYRGHAVNYAKVNAVTLRDLTKGFDRVDFVHLDLQGGEQALIASSETLKCLRDKVSTMLLATHSRLIEGMAIESLTKDGWQLLRERPARFQQTGATDDVVGWTTHDGAQLWVNPRLR